MNLNSFPLLGWFIIFVGVAWLVPRAWQIMAMTAVTILFLGFNAPLSLAVICCCILLSFFPFRHGRHGAAGIITVIGAFLGLLVWFKGNHPIDMIYHTDRLLPLGLSFYVLRAIHYTIDTWKGTLPEHSFRQYLSYHLFLPTIIAGPINRFQEYHRGLNRRRWDSILFSSGCERVLYGYVKIVVLGNYLVNGKIIPLISAHLSMGSAAGAFLDCLIYGMNLYFQFSGYSDVAIGVSSMVGFKVMENFNYPFLAKNINDFWKRWHISLSAWCRDYVYFPLLSHWRSPLVAIAGSMLVLGLWHEFSLRYLAWGFYHAVGIGIWHLFQRVKPTWLNQPDGVRGWCASVLSTALTMNFVILGFAITKEPDIRSALTVYATILGGGK